MSEDVARRKLLSMIENGDISAEEGLRLLNAFDNASEENQDVHLTRTLNNSAFTKSDQDQPDNEGEMEIQHLNSTSDDARRIKRLKKWWFLPFGIGLILTVVSAIWMYLGYVSKGLGWGFWLSWFPFILGIVIMALSAMSSRGKWLHLRVHEKKKGSNTHINISMPLPLGAVRWFFRNFGDKIQKTKNIPIDEILTEFDHGISDDSPFYVKVNDEDENVEVFIG